MSSFTIENNKTNENNMYENKMNVNIIIDYLPSHVDNNSDNYKKLLITNNHFIIKEIKNNDDSVDIAYRYQDNNKIFINYIYLNINKNNFVINIENEFNKELDMKVINVQINFNITNNNVVESSIESMTINKDNDNLLTFENIKSFINNHPVGDCYYFVAGGNCKSSNQNKYYYDNVGDGNCLFNAFAQIFIPKDLGTDEYNKKIPEKAAYLRNIVATVYEKSMENENVRKKYKINDLITVTNDNKTYSIEQYKDYIKTPGSWASDDDLKILSIYFNLNCNIILYYNDEIFQNLQLNTELKNGDMYPFMNIPGNYPFIFCNIGNSHWELKKHNCTIDYSKYSDNSLRLFRKFLQNQEKVDKEVKIDENQEVSNIINAIENFITGKQSEGVEDEKYDHHADNNNDVDHEDHEVDVDHEDHEVDVDHEDHEVDVDHTEANNIQNNITKTTKSNFFIKFSYIIIKNNQKYLFAEIGTAPTTTVVATNTYKEIYNSDGITITEYWQNKTITNELNGYTITDGEEYFVVPFDDINIIQ
jgi:hypothetical protein